MDEFEHNDEPSVVIAIVGIAFAVSVALLTAAVVVLMMR